jgi:YVTN family beta-propeller protein
MLLASLALALAAALPIAAPADGTLIVLNKSDATASFIDPGTGETFLQLPTGVGPHEVAVSPDGSLAVVANYGDRSPPGNSLTVFDLGSLSVRSTIDLELNERPHGLQFVGGNEQILVTIESRSRVIVVDVAQGRVLRSVPSRAEATHMLVASPDGTRAYTANISGASVSVLDLETGTCLTTIPTGAGCEGIDVRPDGKEVWTSNRAADTISIIDTEQLEVVAELPCASFPIRLKFTPDGRRALVSNAESSEVVVFDVLQREELARIPIDFDIVNDAGQRLFGDAMSGSATPIGVLITPDGTRAFVAAANADVVTVLDLEKLAVVGSFVTGKQPDGLGWSPHVRPATPDPAVGDAADVEREN